VGQGESVGEGEGEGVGEREGDYLAHRCLC